MKPPLSTVHFNQNEFSGITLPPPMELRVSEGFPPYLVFPHLIKNATAGGLNLVHGVFTRRGGVGRDPFQSLNTSFSGGDDEGDVKENRRRIQSVLGGRPLIFSNQTHGEEVVVVKNDGFGNLEGDAMVTADVGINLVIQTADCQAVLLFDPEKKVVGAVHSGWRGSLLNIVGKTVEKMVRVFGSNPKRISAGVGPSLGPCCGEFINYRSEIPDAFLKYRTGKNHFDFWKVTKDQLTDAGVLPHNIRVSGVCTKCRSDVFFSYRKEKKTGRFASVIGISPVEQEL